MSEGKELGKGRRRRHQGVMGFLRPVLLFLLTRENAHGYSLLDGLTEFGFNSISCSLRAKPTWLS
jgi:hypothetical protein